MSEMVERVALLTHIEWCKCLALGHPARAKLESDPRALDLILMTWDQFKAHIDEALK